MARRKPLETFTGVTLEQWQNDVDSITWAQQEPRFKIMLSIVLNEIQRLPFEGNESEGCKLGNVQGYLKALAVFRSLGSKPPKIVSVPNVTFDEPSQTSFKEKEPLD